MFPATNERLLELPLRLKLVATGAVTLRVLPLLVTTTAPPPTIETLEDVPFRLKFVAVGTVGPTIVMLDAPLFNVMLFPAINETLDELPFKEKATLPGGNPALTNAAMSLTARLKFEVAPRSIGIASPDNAGAPGLRE